MAGRFDRCPKAWLRDEAARELSWVRDHARYVSHRVMPHAGGWLDQSPLWVEACSVIDDAAGQIDKELARGA